MTIFHAPNILTIVLKRFQVCSSIPPSPSGCFFHYLNKLLQFHALILYYFVQAGSFTKLKKPVQFPDILNLTPYMSDSSDKYPRYSLYAVVVHLDVSSAEFSGHYVCYVKNYREGWFKIDDTVVCLFLLT